MFHWKKNLFILLVLTFVMLGATTVSEAAPTAQAVTLTGVFSILWGDPGPGTNLAPTMQYFLTDAQWNMTEIFVDENVARSVGGVLALNGARITLSGERFVRAQGEVPGVRAQAIQDIAEITSPPVTGSTPWIGIGCKFADVAAEPKSPAYFKDMYGTTYPRLAHYWAEQGLAASLDGSTAVAWFTLPYPKAHYVSPTGYLQTPWAGYDCAAAADAAVDFRLYRGVNFFFNDSIGGAIYGMSDFPMNYDGVSDMKMATWLIPWGYLNLAGMEHEMGHGYGIYHSYSREWDVMSNPLSNCQLANDPVFGCLGQHTIADNKFEYLWRVQALKIAPNTKQTVLLTPHEHRDSTSIFEIKIPIGGSETHYYTVEARRWIGYDKKLPGEGVIIHDVDKTRGNDLAHVVDIDNDGYTGDEGAIWRPGELFSDTVNQIYVCVNSANAAGYNVTAAQGIVPPCKFVTPTPSPGTITAVSTYPIGLTYEPTDNIRPGDWITYRGNILANIPSPQSVNFSFDISGPCGSLHKRTFSVVQLQPGATYVLDPDFYQMPQDLCSGRYTLTFSVLYNTTSVVSSQFTVIGSRTPTHTTTPTRTRTPTRTLTPTRTATFTPSSGWVFCAGENKTCTLPGTRLVRYGANTSYIYKTLSGTFVCSVTTFGSDPLPGVGKHCDYHSNPNQPTPTLTPTKTRVPTRKPGSVTAYSTWTEKEGLHGRPVNEFAPGDVMVFAGQIVIVEGSKSTVELKWTAEGPCGPLYPTQMTFSVFGAPGGIWDYTSAPYTIPPDACAGTYTNTFSVTYNGVTTASSTFTIISTGTPTKTLTPTRTKTATRTPTNTTRTPTATATRTPTTVTAYDWIYCAGENKMCTLPGTRLVRYGANTSYKYKTLSGSFVCTLTTFGGDPLPGVGKHCDYHSNPNQPTPTFTPTKTPLRTRTFTPTATRTATHAPAALCGTKPAAPQLLRPKAGAVIEKEQASLKWAAAECAETYLVIITEVGSEEQAERKAGLTSAGYETRKLKAGHTYEWRVLAVNKHGRSSSEVRHITLK